MGVFSRCFFLARKIRRTEKRHKSAAFTRLEKNGTGSLAELSGFLKDPDRPVRVEAVNAIVRMGSTASLDPLVSATHDTDAEVRVRATDGIVNVYVPGYVANSGLSGYFTRGLRQVKSFFSTRNDKVIDDDVTVREDIGPAIAEEINFGDDMAPRSNAALAAGILRLRVAVPALVEALHAKDNDLIFESLVALQKIHDPSAGAGGRLSGSRPGRAHAGDGARDGGRFAAARRQRPMCGMHLEMRAI